MRIIQQYPRLEIPRDFPRQSNVNSRSATLHKYGVTCKLTLDVTPGGRLAHYVPLNASGETLHRQQWCLRRCKIRLTPGRRIPPPSKLPRRLPRLRAARRGMTISIADSPSARDMAALPLWSEHLDMLYGQVVIPPHTGS